MRLENGTRLYFTGRNLVCPPFTLDHHPYVKTHVGIYFCRDALDFFHKNKYINRASFASDSQLYNSTFAWRSTVGSHTTSATTTPLNTLTEDGENVGTAWKTYRLMLRYMERGETLVLLRGQHIDDAIKDEVHRGYELPHAHHRCKSIGCGGEVEVYCEGVNDGKQLGGLGVHG